MGASASVTPPEGATVIDGSGKSVMPGLVMVHEHLYYPTGPGVYGQLGESFVRLYLAGGVTTMRTGGNVNGFMDFVLKRRIEAGEVPGPAMDATAPYLNGPNTLLQMNSLKDADDARRQVNYWADMGATSFKAYMQITRAELGAAVDEAHKRGLKITGHLCSVTYAEAAASGIDNLEHGFMAATDFVPNKQPDVCPGQGDRSADDCRARSRGRAVQDARQAARRQTRGAHVDDDGVRDVHAGPAGAAGPRCAHAASWRSSSSARTRAQPPARIRCTRRCFPKGMALERAFARAGGTLIAGTDPTGSGGVIPGYSNQRQLELLVEEGFTPLEAIQIGTSNGAKYLGRDARVGTLAIGKQADLVLLAGNPAATIADVRKVETVFRQGVGYDPVKLIDSVKGKVGLW